MLVLCDDNPFELLEMNGYSRYGLGDWSWVKSEKKGRFHCIVDYNKESLRLHFDKVNRNGNFTHHKCEQKGERVI